MDVKRNRGVNFTANEIRIMMDCILKEIDIIENKQTDGVTLGEKRNAWLKIMERFNAASGSNRSVDSLKIKYDNIKRMLKKKMSNTKQYATGTGGGPFKKLNLEDYEEQLLSYLQLSIVGLPSEGDSDGPQLTSGMCEDYGETNAVVKTTGTPDTALDIFEEIIPQTVDSNGSSASYLMIKPFTSDAKVLNKWHPLRAPKSNVLSQPNPIIEYQDHMESRDTMLDFVSEAVTQTANKENLISSPVTTCKKNINKVIKTWSPKPPKSRSQQLGEANKSLTALAEAKQELTMLNMQCTTEELRRKNLEIASLQEQNALKSEILKIELEERKVRLEEFKAECRRKQKIDEYLLEEVKLKVDILRADLSKKFT